MLLKSPKLPGANFPVVKNCPMKADGLNHVTEAASEFTPPHIYTKVACTAKRNFDRKCKEIFETKSAKRRDLVLGVDETCELSSELEKRRADARKETLMLGNALSSMTD